MRKALLFLALMFCINLSWAYDFSAFAPSGQMLSYNIVGGNAQVTYYNPQLPRYPNLTGALVIPATVTYNGTTYSVTSIGTGAFTGCSSLTSVTIPSSVTSIGSSAFSRCSSLTSVTIPSSVTSIGSSAFAGCSSLTSVTIPSSVTNIGYGAFYGCSGLTSVTIPNSVTTIGEEAFSFCSGLTSVTIPGSVTSIGTGAFKSCSGLTSVTIGNSVTNIGDSVFYGCSGLTSVTIPNSVTSIGTGAFNSCSGLTSVTIGNSVTSIGTGAFYGCSGLTSVTIPSSVTNIGYGVFYGCSGLTSVTIPNSVTSIGSSAFAGCSSLTSVTIPGSVTSIGSSAFAGCSGLTSVTIPNSVTSIGNSAFYGCSGLTSVTIPNSVTSIGNSAFYGCSGLTSVTIPNSVTSIGEAAFSACSGLTSVTIPNSVTTIRERTFRGCSGLTSVTIGNSVATIGYEAFAGCSNVDTLYYNAFNLTTTSEWRYNNLYGFRPMKLKYLAIGDSVQSLPTYVFYGQDSLTSVTIPNSVTSIGNIAFCGCSGLTSVTIGNSVTSIGEAAFYGCSGLTSVTIGNSVTSIGEAAFYGCSGLTSVTIPNSVTSIGAETFYGCSGLTSVTIGNSVTTIGIDAFYGCSGLTSVTMIGLNPPALGSGAFDYNSSDRTFSIPCGAYGNYYNGSGWFSYGSALNEPIVNIDVMVNADSETGSASTIQLHGRSVRCDSTIVLVATANYGYHFDHWSTGSAQAQDTIFIDGDTIITAYFAKNQYEITSVSDDESLGMVRGGGTFDYLDTITLTAAPIDHYHFVHWSDGNRENPRQWVVSEDMILTAYFAIDTHSVAVVSNDPTRGMVTSAGSEFEYLSPCTVTATAYTGFVFTGWSNGVTANPYTFAVQSDVELTAIFVSEDELMFTITVETDDPTMGSVSGGGMAMSGGEVTIHAVANEGYHFVRWNDNDTNADRTVTVTADATYTAYFAADQSNGINEISGNVAISVCGNSIFVSNAQKRPLRIFDIQGRMIVSEKAVDGKQYLVPHTGVYMVQIGNYPAQKVVVVR